MNTEEEARQCWCPFARYSVEGSAWKRAINRWIGKSDRNINPEPAHCIASECMAWRWVEEDWEPGEQIWEQGGGSFTTEKPPKPRGYCGLAGKP